MSGPVLSVERLDAGYGPLHILFGVSLSVAASEQLLVFGPNGAGKSTLLKAIVGLVGVSQGEVRLGGRDITHLPTERITRLGLGYVPQLENVFGSMSVEENLEIGGMLLGRSKRSRIRELYQLFPVLADKRRQSASSLSGGQRQLLAMARALMPSPALLLLDEPTAGLAPKLVADMFATIRQISRTGVGVLLVEQNAKQALPFVDRGCVMESGRIRFEDAASALLAREDIGQLYLGGSGLEAS